MTFKELKPKYKKVEIYIDKENFGLMEIPQITEFEFAKTMYADRKVIFYEDYDNREITEILIESEDGFRKRQKFEN